MPLPCRSGISADKHRASGQHRREHRGEHLRRTQRHSIIQRLPLIARRVILSITIIELSTIIPTPRIRPASDMTLIEIPASLKQSIVSSSDSGMLTTMSSGILTSRINAKSTRHASAIPRARFHERLLIEYESRLVWSRVSTNFTPDYPDAPPPTDPPHSL